MQALFFGTLARAMPSAALVRHPAARCAALRGIRVSIERKSESLRVAYVLEGEIDRLRIPAPRAARSAERLWQHTCCELFISRDGAPGYREFNFSPSGEWAAYEFPRYRQGKSFLAGDPSIAVKRAAGRLELAAKIQDHPGRIRIGLSAVIEDEEGTLSYWALRHAPGQPDFHHPDAFAMELDEARA
jgi:hypothetical protein